MMTLSPKKYVSNFTASTTNKGVEAKEIEIANTVLGHSDMNLSERTESCIGSLRDDAPRAGCGGSGEANIHSQMDSPQTSNGTASFIQVVVQKHHKKGKSTTVAAQTSPLQRLPTASSPISKTKAQISSTVPPQLQGPYSDGSGQFVDCAPGPALYMMPHPMMLSYPQPVPPHPSQTHLHSAYGWPAQAYKPHRAMVEVSTSARSSSSFRKLVRAARCERKKKPKMIPAPAPVVQAKENVSDSPVKRSFWKRISGINEDSTSRPMPERVEVHYLERGGRGDALVSREAVACRTERVAARAHAAFSRALAELLAVPHCLALLPLTVALHLLRVACSVGRAAVGGAAHTAGEHLLKPLLAVAYNALLHPPLLCAGHALAALRDALRPLAALLGDLLAPLAAFRLVHVHVSR